MTGLNAGVFTMAVLIERSTLIGVADATLAERLNRESARYPEIGPITVVADLAELREQLAACSPRVILLDDEILSSLPLIETLRQLTERAPVVLVAAFEWQTEIARLVAEGDVDFVARVGNFAALASSLLARRLRWATQSETALGPPWAGLPIDTAEILRHEINNPLTGILGNAELVLSHRERLPPADALRLQTVVDLAVRLREATRRLSNAWEARQAR